jgi:CDP-6-deoxy-D-xylo-4-hexulose-3-dehydrase
LPRLEDFIRIRQENANFWGSHLTGYSQYIEVQRQRPDTRHVWFAYPLLVKEGAPFTAKELMAHLEGHGVECRPIEAGNMAVQPAMKELNYRAEPIPNAEYIHSNAFFFGNHSGIGAIEREAIASYIHEFMKGYK